MPFDPLSSLRKRKQRQQSDVAQKLIAMCLHEVSASLVRADPQLRVETPEYERAVRQAFGSSCAFCDEPLTGDVHVEHLDAMNRVRAGLHIAGNVVLSCKPCNMAKRNDDQGKGALVGNDGWSNFLAHSGAECPATCPTCKYWRDRIPDDARRHQVLKDRRERIEAFRAQFRVPALRASSLEMVSGLEQLYRQWQDNAQLDTKAFVDKHASPLLSTLASTGRPTTSLPSSENGERALAPRHNLDRGPLRTKEHAESVGEAFAPGEYYAGGGALPIPLTLSALEAYLKDRKFEVDNNRPNQGGFWVKYDPSFSTTQESLERLGIEVRPAPRRNRPGEWLLIDGGKRLR